MIQPGSDSTPREPRIDALRRLAAQNEPLPSGTNWERIEARVFDHLDRQRAPLGVLAWIARPMALTGVAAACVAVVVALAGYHRFHRQASDSCAISIRTGGVVEYCIPAADSTVWRPMESLETLCAGVRIRTGADSWVSATVAAGTGFMLDGGAEVVLAAFEPDHQMYRLTRGAIQVQLARVSAGQTLVVETGNALCEAVGTVYSVSCAPDSARTTSVAVIRGTVRVTPLGSPEQVRTLSAPATLAVSGSGAVEPILLGAAGATPTDTVIPVVVGDHDTVAPIPYVPPVLMQTVELAPPEPEPLVVEPAQLLPDDGDEPTAKQESEPVVAPATVLVKPSIDSAYVAGAAFGRALYWRKESLPTDTIGLAEALLKLGVESAPGGGTVESASSACRAAGRKLVWVVDPTAAAFAALAASGFKVLVLSQWQVTLAGLSAADRRTFIGQGTARSHVMWESVESVNMGPAGMTGIRRQVRVSFAGLGTGVYDGEKKLGGSTDAPIGGFEGLRGRASPVPLNPGHVRRTIHTCYLVVDQTVSVEQVRRAVEKQMDTYGLDMSFKAPEFREVQ